MVSLRHILQLVLNKDRSAKSEDLGANGFEQSILEKGNFQPPRTIKLFSLPL